MFLKKSKALQEPTQLVVDPIEKKMRIKTRKGRLGLFLFFVLVKFCSKRIIRTKAHSRHGKVYKGKRYIIN